MSKSPKSPFNLASGAWGQEKADQHDQNQGPDKDNAAQRFDPPNQSQNPAPNLAPPGMSGGSSGANKGHEDNEPESNQTDEIHITFTPDVQNSDRKVEITSDDETIDGVLPDGNNFLVKQTSDDMPDGQDNKKISYLTIFDENQEGVEFREGSWVIEPQTDPEKDNVRFLEEKFGDLEHSKFKSFDDLNKGLENDHKI
jgi:hypothetical protein